MADCTHGMPTPASCVECMEDGNLAPPPRPEAETMAGPARAAVYPGQCEAAA